MLLLKKDNLTIIMDDGGKFQWEEKFNQWFYKYVVSFTVLVNGKMKTFSRAMFVRVKDTYSRVQDWAGENVNTIKNAISDVQENVW